MKINPSNGLANPAIADRTPVNANSGKVADTRSGTVDRTTLSTSLPTVTNMVKQAMQVPTVRQDRVSSLRDAISSGNYQIDPTKIANSIASESVR